MIWGKGDRACVIDRYRSITCFFGLGVLLLGLSVGASAQRASTVRPTDTVTVTIKTEPNATVWIDGVRFGRTGEDGVLAIRLAPSARRTVRVRADGFKEVEKPVALSAGSAVAIALSKTTDKAELTFQEAERLALRDRQKSADAYRAAIKLRPTYVAAHIGLARILSESGDTENALRAVRDVRRVAPRNAEASAIEGRIFKDTGEEEKAIAAFKRAIAEGRGFQPEALTGLGLIFKERAETVGGVGNFDQESADYEQSGRYLRQALQQLAGAPDATVIYQLLGLVLERQKKFDEAIAIYNEFIRRFPDSNEVPTVKSFIEQLRKQRDDQPQQPL